MEDKQRRKLNNILTGIFERISNGSINDQNDLDELLPELSKGIQLLSEVEDEDFWKVGGTI